MPGLLNVMLISALLANCIAWVRKGDADHDGCVVVICNGKDDGNKRCEVGKDHAGEKWTDVLGWHQGEVTIGEGERTGVCHTTKLSECRWLGGVLVSSGEPVDLDQERCQGEEGVQAVIYGTSAAA